MFNLEISNEFGTHFKRFRVILYNKIFCNYTFYNCTFFIFYNFICLLKTVFFIALYSVIIFNNFLFCCI